MKSRRSFSIAFASALWVLSPPASYADGSAARIGKADSFLPPGWTIVYRTPGDLNRDGRPDLVLVIDPPGEEADERLLLILEARPDGRYVLAASAPEIAHCRRCGGVFGDPGMDPEIRDGVLTVGNYGGSAWRWSVTYVMEKISGEYQLTSYESSSFHSLQECEETSLRYAPLTGDVVLEERKMKAGECVESEQKARWTPAGGFRLRNRDAWNLPQFTEIWKK